MMVINPSVLRLLWSAVEEIQGHELMNLSDAALINLILQQVADRSFLSGEEDSALSEYARAKIPLIRDMAIGRMA